MDLGGFDSSGFVFIRGGFPLNELGQFSKIISGKMGPAPGRFELLILSY